MIQSQIVEEEVNSITWDYSYRYSDTLLLKRLLQKTWKMCKQMWKMRSLEKIVWDFGNYESSSGESVILSMGTSECGLRETPGVVKKVTVFRCRCG